jgi:hypothetical protein
MLFDPSLFFPLFALLGEAEVPLPIGEFECHGFGDPAAKSGVFDACVGVFGRLFPWMAFRISEFGDGALDLSVGPKGGANVSDSGGTARRIVPFTIAPLDLLPNLHLFAFDGDGAGCAMIDTG